MKQCNNCRMQLDDRTVTCPYCGSTELSELKARANPLEIEEKGSGNVIAGVVGAFLFALIGGLLYFIIYQVGYIAGICGLVIFILANYGYHLFAKGEKDSLTGLIIAVVITVLVIFLAEYLSLSYEIFTVFRDEYDITIFDAIRATPDFLSDPEIMGPVAKDLLMAYGFSIIGIISNFANRRKAKKQAAQKEAETETEETPTV